LFGTNRVVVVDETGRVYERLGVQVVMDLQDGGRTLKLFIKEDRGWNSPEKVKGRMQKALQEWMEARRAILLTQLLPNKTPGPSTEPSGTPPTT
jgi:hypothetical protein